MTRPTEWGPTEADNEDPAKGGHKEKMDRSAVNDQSRDNLASIRNWIEDGEWQDLNEANGDDFTVARVADTIFNVVDADGTDARSKYSAGSWLKIHESGSFTYAEVVSATYATPPNTVVTVTNIRTSGWVATAAISTGALTTVEVYFNRLVREATFHPVGTTTSQSPSQIPSIDDLGDGATIDQGTGNGFDADTVDGKHAADLLLAANGTQGILINGAMNVWQRGTSFAAIADATYAADRWKILEQTTTEWDISREDTLAPAGFRHSMKLEANGTDTQVMGYQAILGVNSAEIIGNGKASLSLHVLMQKSTAFNSAYAAILEWSGTEDAPDADPISGWNSSPTQPTLKANWSYAGKTATITADDDWQEITLEDVTIASGTKNLAVVFWMDDQSYSATNAWYVSGLQIVPGSTAASYMHRPWEAELELCRKFFVKTFPYAVKPADATDDAEGVVYWLGHASPFEVVVNWFFGTTLWPDAMSVYSAGITIYNPVTGGTANRPYNFDDGGVWGGGALSTIVGATGVTVYGTGASADVSDRCGVHITMDVEL